MTPGPPPASTSPASTTSPIPRWTLADLVDFEVLLSQEEASPEPAWKSEWLANRTTQATAGDLASRRSLFHEWLEFRRREPGARLPGDSVASGWRSLAALGGFAGVLLGAGVTGSLLHYRGTEPVNVAWFLVCTLGLQWFLLLGALGIAALRRTTGLTQDIRPLRHGVSALAWLCSAGLRRLPGEQREQLRARMATLSRKREIYGSLTTWPILVVTQWFAVGYNVGILALLLAHVATTDLAFGWQSTLDLGPEAVHRLAAAVATPWSWFAPHPHPDLPQIVGSRFSYAQGMAGLDRAALAAWWPFLAYTIVVYGALVRALALAFAVHRLRRTIARWPFDHQGCNTLARHLTGPLIHAQGDTAALAIPDSAAPCPAPIPSRSACLALVATDLEPSSPLVEHLLARAFGLPLASMLPVQIDHPSGNPSALQAVADSASSRAPVVIVAPAHRAPIKAIGLFLQRIVDAAGSPREVILLLVGRRSTAGDDSSFEAVPDVEFRHWRNLLAIHRLAIGLERLRPA